jgi:hypothetical protein
MGKIEERDARKVLAGETIILQTKKSLLDYILLPYRAYKQWKVQREFRKKLFKF